MKAGNLTGCQLYIMFVLFACPINFLKNWVFRRRSMLGLKVARVWVGLMRLAHTGFN